MKGILVDENGDLMVSGGTLAIGEPRWQWAQHVIGAFTGEYKLSPLIGGNARRMIAGRTDPFWAGGVKNQLKQCLAEANSVKVTEDGIVVELRVVS